MIENNSKPDGTGDNCNWKIYYYDGTGDHFDETIAIVIGVRPMDH